MQTKITISQFIPEVRAILRDTKSAYYSDSQIANGIVDALRRMYSRRPATRLDGMKIVDMEFPQDDQLPEFEILFDNKYKLGVVYFAAARCYESDIKDTVHQQLAMQLKQMADAEFAV